MSWRFAPLELPELILLTPSKRPKNNKRPTNNKCDLRNGTPEQQRRRQRIFVSCEGKGRRGLDQQPMQTSAVSAEGT
jgi:hypothetical protein